jgi:hypothetical protein
MELQIWALGFDQAAPELLQLEQGEATSATMSLNKTRTACYFPGSVFFALPRLTLADRGGEEMKMMWAVIYRAGGGGSTFAAARGHNAEWWLRSFSSSTPFSGRSWWRGELGADGEERGLLPFPQAWPCVFFGFSCSSCPLRP